MRAAVINLNYRNFLFLSDESVVENGGCGKKNERHWLLPERTSSGEGPLGANAIVAQLCSLGILEEATGYKCTHVFRYAPYIAIFGDTALDQSAESKEEQP